MILSLLLLVLLAIMGTLLKIFWKKKESLPISTHALPSTSWKKLFHLQSVDSNWPSEHIIRLMIKPRQGQFFKGNELKSAFDTLGLVPGPDRFYHKVHHLRTLYTVCHLYAPGTFSFFNPEQTVYSGLMIIFMAHEVPSPKEHFEKLMKESHDLTVSLQGQLLDEHANPLNATNYQFIKQQFHSWLIQYESNLAPLET